MLMGWRIHSTKGELDLTDPFSNLPGTMVARPVAPIHSSPATTSPPAKSPQTTYASATVPMLPRLVRTQDKVASEEYPGSGEQRGSPRSRDPSAREAAATPSTKFCCYACCYQGPTPVTNALFCSSLGGSGRNGLLGYLDRCWKWDGVLTESMLWDRRSRNRRSCLYTGGTCNPN